MCNSFLRKLLLDSFVEVEGKFKFAKSMDHQVQPSNSNSKQYAHCLPPSACC